jgi:hypothetical protein
MTTDVERAITLQRAVERLTEKADDAAMLITGRACELENEIAKRAGSAAHPSRWAEGVPIVDSTFKMGVDEGFVVMEGGHRIHEKTIVYSLPLDYANGLISLDEAATREIAVRAERADKAVRLAQATRRTRLLAEIAKLQAELDGK